MLRQSAKLCCLVLGLGAGLGLALLPAAGAQAVPVTTTVTGNVLFADAANPFGLTTADSVTAVALYDDSLIPAAGAFILEIDSNPGFELTITLGSFVFEETDDDQFGSGHPSLTFNDGALVGIEFEIDGFPLGAFTDLIVGAFNADTRWFLDERVPSAPDNELLEGAWDFANAVTVPAVVASVPEPAAWLLFAGGLAGLAGMTGRARHKRPGS